MKPAPIVALPSWNECAAKQAILDFVRRVTSHGESDFVPENERIAVFDNDGTLWSEQPVPVQLFFAFDAAKERASISSRLKNKEPFKSLLAGDLKAVSPSSLTQSTKRSVLRSATSSLRTTGRKIASCCSRWGFNSTTSRN